MLASHPELTQVVIKMLVLHHAPARSRNTPEDSARRPGGRRSSRPKPLNQIPQPPDVRRPRRRARGEKLRWTLALPFRPRHHMNSQPIHRKPRERTGWRPGVELAQSLPQVGTHVTHHFGGRKSAPHGLALRPEARDPVEAGGADLRIKE